MRGTAPEHIAAERHSRLRAASVESMALGVAAVSFAASVVVSFFVFGSRELPIAGVGSIGEYTAIAGCAIALVTYIAGRVARWSVPPVGASPAGSPSRMSIAVEVFDSAAIAIAHAIIVLLLWTVLADVLSRSFQDATLFAVPSVLLASAAAAASGYYVFLSAANMNPLLLSTVLAVFLAVGGLTSMITASKPHWWKQNLSVLGITNDISGMTFTVTVIVAGIMITAIARYVTGTGGRRPTSGELYARWSLITIGALLACVGLFPVNRFFLLHNTVATGMTVVFSVLAVGVRWAIPGLPRAFIVLGWVFIGVIASVAFFFWIGYYNLTAVELVAAVLIFSWIIVFLRISVAADDDLMTPGDPPSSVVE